MSTLEKLFKSVVLRLEYAYGFIYEAEACVKLLSYCMGSLVYSDIRCANMARPINYAT